MLLGTSKQDQLRRIIKIIGFPDPSFACYFHSNEDIQYIKHLRRELIPEKDGIQAIVRNNGYDPVIYQQFIDLLNKLLKFHPNHRISCTKALDSQLFSIISSNYSNDLTTKEKTDIIDLNDIERISPRRDVLISLLHKEVENIRNQMHDDESIETEFTIVKDKQFDHEIDNYEDISLLSNSLVHSGKLF